MESILYLLAGALLYRKPPNTFRKYQIPNTECSVMMLPSLNHQTLHTSENELLHYANCSEGNVHYGVLCAVLNKSLNYFEAEEKLSRFTDSVREGLNIPYNVGISTGNTLRDEKNTLGINDYWQDKKGIDWEVRGYSDGKYMAVLYVKGITACDSAKMEAFFNSFEFPK